MASKAEPAPYDADGPRQVRSNVHALVATGVNCDGHREIPADQGGLDGASARTAPAGGRSCAGWSPAAWPRSNWSSLTPIRPDIGDRVGAARRGLAGCRTHYLRNLLTRMPKSIQSHVPPRSAPSSTRTPPMPCRLVPPRIDASTPSTATRPCPRCFPGRPTRSGGQPARRSIFTGRGRDQSVRHYRADRRREQRPGGGHVNFVRMINGRWSSRVQSDLLHKRVLLRRPIPPLRTHKDRARSRIHRNRGLHVSGRDRYACRARGGARFRLCGPLLGGDSESRRNDREECRHLGVLSWRSPRIGALTSSE
jgi:hypothetical protein